MQAIADSTPDLFVSQNETKIVGLLFYPQKFLLIVEFVQSSVGQEICIKSKKILEQRSMHC